MKSSRELATNSSSPSKKQFGGKLTWLGHAAVEIRTPGGRAVVIDPWYGNPKSPKPATAVTACDLLLVTHGHSDHFGDALAIASRLGPTWPAIHEMGLWLARRLPGGADAVIGMNKGGTVEAAGLKFTMVQALHSSGIEDGGQVIYGGEACGCRVFTGLERQPAVGIPGENRFSYLRPVR